MAGCEGAEQIGRIPAASGSCSAIDLRACVGGRQLPMVISDSHAELLASWGRTEDLAASPNENLLVVAGFNSDRLHFVRFHLDLDSVYVEDVWDVEVAGLVRPHGITFVDPNTLLIANREAELSLVRFESGERAPLSATVVLDATAQPPVRTPGSVAVRSIGDELVEIFVCNNYAHDVTRHVLDGRTGWSAVDGERLLADGLEIPDGIAVSADGQWIAVSNHNRNSVHLYLYDDLLGVDSPPTGVLHGMNYPHGLSFADDDRQLVVVDAGLPYMYTFEALDRNWTGPRVPERIDRVMDDEAFHRGRYNPQEGGMKGLVVVAGRLAAVTSEFAPLAFFELDDQREEGAGHARFRSQLTTDTRVPILRLAQRVRRARAEQTTTAVELGEVEQERDQLRIELEACRLKLGELEHRCRTVQVECAEHLGELDRARRHHADAGVELDRLLERNNTLESHIEAMHASRSWKWSTPLRAASWAQRTLGR